MKILLADWASRNYSPPPSEWVLRKWARAGQIVPTPEKVGSAYYVEEAAKRVTARRPTPVERLRATA